VNIYEKKQVWKYFLFIAALVIGAGSLYYTNRLADSIEKQERKQIELWAEATRILGNNDFTSSDIRLPLQVLENNTQIPVILATSTDSILEYRNLDSARVEKSGYLGKVLLQMKSENDSIVINLGNNLFQYLYYRNSDLLRKIAVFPYIQLGVIILFILVSYLAFSISRKAEQNEVWTGLSKETAHQLGTPISSLMGWIELLKNHELDKDALPEIEKDAKRLEKIADRFSKIGSKPTLKVQDIVAVLESGINYISMRKSKSIKILSELPSSPITVPINETLFEWVIENLLKNAMDATEGSGIVKVRCTDSGNQVFIDIEDNGKGIQKSKFKTVFKPGYTTKRRGWGLGLSLSKRIIETYHDGKIFVHSSDPGIRTVFRIILSKQA
jgi:two-component system, sporulation sensor kinase D